MEFDAERQTFAAWLGTSVATIFGPVPLQETAVIFRSKWVNPTAGTVASSFVAGYLLSSPSLTGYSSMGTVTPNGSILDAAVVTNGNESGGGQDAEAPIAVVPPGAYLTGITAAGSILVVGLYSYRLGRSA
jgi:hypothetical protein